MNVLSLFAGIGGLDLGLERAGMTVVGQVEIAPFCRRVLAKHWPDVPRHDDVRTCVEWWRSGPRPAVHVVAGGYPCQPESTAGQGLSTDDERWLWPDMARVIHAIRPRFVIGENVMGHRTRGLRFVLRDLERLGYTARAGTLAASEVGAPHPRRRIFILAELADTEGIGWGPGRPGRPAVDGASRPPVPAAGPAGAGADAAGEGRRPGWSQPGSEGAPCCQDAYGPESSGGAWWATEPDVDRVAYGVPGGVDRTRALGNAVVPQVAEHIGRLILAADHAAVTA